MVVHVLNRRVKGSSVKDTLVFNTAFKAKNEDFNADQKVSHFYVEPLTKIPLAIKQIA